MPHSTVLDHLTRLYASSDDPWDHRTSPYEAAKYDATLAAIGAGPFRAALEIGCGNGTLAQRLAKRCHHLTAMDCIPAAAEAARRAVPDAHIITGCAPADLPDMRPDLTLLSEVLYFLSPDEIATLATWLRANADGPIVAVNWTGPTDEPLDGPAAVALLAKGLTCVSSQHHRKFRIDIFAP